MAITRYTSPPITLLVKGVNIVAAEIYVTVKQGNVEFDRTGTQLSVSASGSDTQIIFYLSQEEAAKFNIKANAEIQVNWISGGTRYATEIKKVRIYNNLLEEVLP